MQNLQESVREAVHAVLQHVQASLPEAVLYPALAQSRQGMSFLPMPCFDSPQRRGFIL